MLHLFMYPVVGRFDKKNPQTRLLSHLLGATPLVKVIFWGDKHRYFAFICHVHVAVCDYMFVCVTVGPTARQGQVSDSNSN